MIPPFGSDAITVTLASFGGTACGDPTQILPDLVVWEDEQRGYMHDWYFDTVTIPGRTLLRLSTAIANAGAGPLEVRGGQGPGGVATETVTQRIFHADGCFEDVPVGQFVFHPSHFHVHFEGWAQYRLRQVNPDGTPGATVAQGEKTSFCILDVTRYPHAPADTSTYNGCNRFQGLSPGWADVYGATLPDQWIDITGVPQCQYWLEQEADPDNRIVESDETNNIERLLIDLGGGACPTANCPGGCDDGVFCNGLEFCNAGTCSPGPTPCPGEFCDEANDRCVACLTDADCDNGLFCDGIEECHDGECDQHDTPCEGAACDEPTDSCAACGVDADCDNGVFCDGAETCVLGQCQSAGNPCPIRCRENPPACVECFVDAECSDGRFCTGNERCVAGACTPGAAPCEGVCDEAADTCAVDTGCVVDAECDDGSFCNGAEICVVGQCIPGQAPCPATACNELAGACVECTTHADCDDGLFCNGVETCRLAQCQPGGDPCPNAACTESSDSCSADVECVVHADCSDGRFCNGTETCVGNSCQRGGWACGGGQWCLEWLDLCADCISDDECPGQCVDLNCAP